jgi:hypothetical protein
VRSQHDRASAAARAQACGGARHTQSGWLRSCEHPLWLSALQDTNPNTRVHARTHAPPLAASTSMTAFTGCRSPSTAVRMRPSFAPTPATRPRLPAGSV